MHKLNKKGKAALYEFILFTPSEYIKSSADLRKLEEEVEMFKNIIHPENPGDMDVELSISARQSNFVFKPGYFKWKRGKG